MTTTAISSTQKSTAATRSSSPATKTLAQTKRLKKLKGDASSQELQALRDLHVELANTGRLGDLPKQSKLSNRAIEYCLGVLNKADQTCTCEGARGEEDQRLPPRFMCPSCQRVLRILRVWLQIETLSVRRAAIEERLFMDIVKAKLSLPDADGVETLGFAGVVRRYRDNPPNSVDLQPMKEAEVGT